MTGNIDCVVQLTFVVGGNDRRFFLFDGKFLHQFNHRMALFIAELAQLAQVRRYNFWNFQFARWFRCISSWRIRISVLILEELPFVFGAANHFPTTPVTYRGAIIAPLGKASHYLIATITYCIISDNINIYILITRVSICINKDTATIVEERNLDVPMGSKLTATGSQHNTIF